MTLDLIKSYRLFSGIAPEDIPHALQCLHAIQAEFGKGDVLLNIDQTTDEAGLLLNGCAQVVIDNMLGRRIVVEHIMPGDVFGEIALGPGVQKTPVCIRATGKCTALKLKIGKIVSPHACSCHFRTTIMENLLISMSEYNRKLNQRLDILSYRTLRQKIQAYLLMRMQETGNHQFSIPFNRNDLADYLQIERSALSRELGKMRDEGLIAYCKSDFYIINTQEMMLK